MSSIFKNIRFSIITFISQLLSGGILYILFARLLSLNDFGILSFGATFAGLISVMAEFGYSLMAQRDIPQNRFDFNKYVFNSFIQKFVLSVIVILGGIAYLYYFFSDDNFKVGIIFLIYAIITAIVMYLLAIFRAKNKFIVESKSSIIYSLIIVILILLYLYLKFDVIYIAIGILLARLIQLIILFSNYFRIFGWFDFNVDKVIQKYLFKNSFSFGIHYLIGIFYFSIDSQMIAYYWGNESLAIYQAFFRIVLLMLVIGDLLSNVFLPYLSSLFVGKIEIFYRNVLLFNKVFFSLGLFLFVLLNLFAKDIVQVLYSVKYIDSISLTIPLSFVLLFRIMSTLYAILLTISNNQSVRVFVVFVSLIINIILNFIFIPKFGYHGAAYVSLVTHAVLFGLYLIFGIKYFNEAFINYQYLVFVLFTIALVLIMKSLNIEFEFLYSTIILIIWCFSLLFVWKKHQLLELKTVLTK